MIKNINKLLKPLLNLQQQQKVYFCQANKDADFGFRKVKLEEKQGMVNQVFHSVADKYDLMNDVLSLGIHRCWKEEFVSDLGILRSTRIQEKDQIVEYPARIIDVAGGTGDIAFKILEKHKQIGNYSQSKNLKVTVVDINESMLEVGKKRAIQRNLNQNEIEFACGNAEQLQFEDNTFDAYTIAFGIRNVPRIDKALNEAYRVLKKGGRLMILEFSKVQNFPLNEIYRQYNSNLLPILGQLIAGDKESYQYLAESIEKFHDQERLLNLIEQSGFKFASYKNLSQGICAIHTGFKL